MVCVVCVWFGVDDTGGCVDRELMCHPGAGRAGAPADAPFGSADVGKYGGARGLGTKDDVAISTDADRGAARETNGELMG